LIPLEGSPSFLLILVIFDQVDFRRSAFVVDSALTQELHPTKSSKSEGEPHLVLPSKAKANLEASKCRKFDSLFDSLTAAFH
jgi:hypothetical protein